MKQALHRILLIRTAWMKYYEGRADIDPPMSGARHFKRYKTGGEIYNFKNRNGKFLGYVPYIDKLNINNLGARSTDELIKNVTVVFCATHPKEKGMRVVGWYKDAIVYRNPQPITYLEWGIHIKADASKSKLIDYTNRFFNMPDIFGRSALYYFSNHPEKRTTLNKLLIYIKNNGELPNRKQLSIKFPRQHDIDKRLQVEKKAIDIAKKFYGDRYGLKNIKSVEKDNVGWDLEINAGAVKLKVEVKGLSGNQLVVELTPNEFKTFNRKLDTYQLFVVTNVLDKNTKSQVFTYQRKGNMWVGNDKDELAIKRILSARISLR